MTALACGVKERSPLEGLPFLRKRLVCVALRTGTAIEDSDRVGLQFDDKLLNHVIDRFFADRHLDRAVILPRGQFALDEYERALDEAFGDGREALAVGNDAMPLRPVLPFALLVLPGLLGGNGEFDDGGAIRQMLDLGVLADESNDAELIDHDDFLLSARLLGHENASGACSEAEEVHLLAGPKNLIACP